MFLIKGRGGMLHVLDRWLKTWNFHLNDKITKKHSRLHFSLQQGIKLIILGWIYWIWAFERLAVEGGQGSKSNYGKSANETKNDPKVRKFLQEIFSRISVWDHLQNHTSKVNEISLPQPSWEKRMCSHIFHFLALTCLYDTNTSRLACISVE